MFDAVERKQDVVVDRAVVDRIAQDIVLACVDKYIHKDVPTEAITLGLAIATASLLASVPRAGVEQLRAQAIKTLQ
jgi:hypothetical protein